MVPLNKEHSRKALLTLVSRQFDDIAQRVERDIHQHANASPVPAAVGFMLYFLRNADGEPLKDTVLTKHGINRIHMEETEGFRKLRDTCQRKQLGSRLEEHFYTHQPNLTRIYKVVVDGWA
ncbi:hypothetical protein [Oceanibaculum pacificum]|uniref:Uncharacterized protein n=1 Tax=Oceanibaculum pacificum TaxID=580166 RepID=A0A154W9U7_9PROT|nr:hypothetical protein [Oceanibaculum pacificum]KZD10291.1 hypothetical protein AUP43_06090 [Oceanibaculum pacificum]